MIWPLESRRKTMREAIASVAAMGGLHRVKPSLFAATYGTEILPCEVEAEMLKHQTEGGEGK